MNSIKHYIDYQTIVMGLTVFVSVGYYYLIFELIKRRRKQREKKKEVFFDVLIKGVKNNTVKNVNDLINIYKGSTNLSTEDLSYRFGLNKWLRELLVQVISGKFDEFQDAEKSLEKLVEKINEFISNNEKESPFSDLPDTERNILSDISAYIKNNDQSSANRKIEELGNIIQTRNEDQKKLETQNKWTFPLSIVGAILTIVFGLISLFK